MATIQSTEDMHFDQKQDGQIKAHEDPSSHGVSYTNDNHLHRLIRFFYAFKRSLAASVF